MMIGSCKGEENCGDGMMMVLGIQGRDPRRKGEVEEVVSASLVWNPR
jgi:hypothetical protein